MEEDRAFEDGPLAGGHEDARPIEAELWCAALWECGGVSGDADWRPRARGTVAEAADGVEPPAGRTTGEEGAAMDGQRESFRAYDRNHDDFEDEDLVERDEFGVEEFGCVFGAACCMPGYHFPSECHTAEMAEAYHGEAGDGDEP
jgi:hypothetical protein